MSIGGHLSIELLKHVLSSWFSGFPLIGSKQKHSFDLQSFPLQPPSWIRGQLVQGPQDLVWTYPLQMAVSLVLWAPKVQKWQLVPFIFCYSHHLTQGPNRPWSWRWTMRRHSWLHRHEWTSRYFSLMELLDTFSDYMYIYCIYIII